MSYCLAYVTCPNKREAEKIARVLVEEKLAACVNIQTPSSSFYIWNGACQIDEEVIFLAKTKEKLFLNLTERVCELHSYQTPCVLKIPMQIGNQSYQEFLEKNTI